MNVETQGVAADPDLVAALREVVGSASLSAADPDGTVPLDVALWRRLDDLGFARLTWPEETGGSGAGWAEAGALLGECARHGVSLPLVEHDLLTGWLLRSTGLTGDDRLRTVAMLDSDGRGTAVPWARYAEVLVTVRRSGDRWLVAEVPVSAATLTPGTNLAGEPRDGLVVALDPAAGVAVEDEIVERMWLDGALARAVQVAGALERILRLTATYAQERVQFGRPLARFQAVQHLLADMAAETALARASVDAAVMAAATGAAETDLGFRVGVARSCAGRAASVVVRHGHQLHGAIGTTAEHTLHRSTLAALAWRAEFGTTESWELHIAETVREAGPGGIWALIVG